MHSHRLLTLTLIALTSALGGCVTATVQQVREAATGMSEGDSVVVLGRAGKARGAETEEDFVTCVGRNMGAGSDPIPVISEQEFKDALFPWFEPRIAPVAARELPELLAQPLMSERLQDIGLRYLIWVDGSTQRTDETGSMSCTVTPGAAGCFGFLSWEHDSSYEASVWDIHTGRPVGKVSSDATGTSYMPAVVVPLPFVARVRTQACNTLAGQLKTFIIEG
ncbi:MAG: hypothetical protein AAF515_19430 [Pseudomonadota bacterium]